MSRPSRLPYVLVIAFVIVLGALFAEACGGGQTNDTPPPICYRSQPIPDGGGVRPLRPNEWGELILSSWGEGQRASQTCANAAIEWRATNDECDIHEPEDEPAPQPVSLTNESVVVGRSDSVAIKPVWIVTHHFENGDGFGPVALTERTAEGIGVRAIGTLRLPMGRARLRLRETGGQQIIVADGERCPDEDEQGGAGSDDDAPPANAGGEESEEEEEEPTCLRESRLLPVVGDQVLNPEVRTPDGRCLGPAQVYLQREHVAALENGWERVFRLAASIEYQGNTIVIHEQVTAQDRDPRDPGRPPLSFRTTDGDRIIMLSRGGMRSRGMPLFERAIRADGSTQLPIAEGPQDEEESGSGRGPRATN